MNPREIKGADSAILSLNLFLFEITTIQLWEQQADEGSPAVSVSAMRQCLDQRCNLSSMKHFLTKASRMFQTVSTTQRCGVIPYIVFSRATVLDLPRAQALFY